MKTTKALQSRFAISQTFSYYYLKRLSYSILALVLLTQNLGYSQNSTYENLVFGGGSIRGIAFAGVIKQLEENDIMCNIKKVGGTSVGSIIALLVSLGYTSDEIYEIISETNFQRFNDKKFIFFDGVIRLNKKYGWYRGDKLKNWLENIIINKTGNADITLKQLEERGFKQLYVTATCLNKQKLLILSAENYPNMKAKDAVRIAVSIPLYYKAIFIDGIGNVYDDPKKIKGLDVVVDGGITGHYPIFLFDNIQTDSLDQRFRIPNKKTLGIKIESDDQVKEDFNNKQLVSMKVNNLSDYLSAIYVYVIESLNRYQLTDEDWDRTISVSSVGISRKIKRLSKKQKLSLVKSGEKYTKDFFLKRNAK